jgi:hypothetical protein
LIDCTECPPLGCCREGAPGALVDGEHRTKER